MADFMKKKKFRQTLLFSTKNVQSNNTKVKRLNKKNMKYYLFVKSTKGKGFPHLLGIHPVPKLGRSEVSM